MVDSIQLKGNYFLSKIQGKQSSFSKVICIEDLEYEYKLYTYILG